MGRESPLHQHPESAGELGDDPGLAKDGVEAELDVTDAASAAATIPAASAWNWKYSWCPSVTATITGDRTSSAASMTPYTISRLTTLNEPSA